MGPTIVVATMATVTKSVSTFIVQLESPEAAQAYTPLFLKYTPGCKTFFGGEAVPTAVSAVPGAGLRAGCAYIFAGIVLPAQPRQTLIQIGLAVVAVCTHGPCTALLCAPPPAGRDDELYADVERQRAPGDPYEYRGVACGTIIKHCNTVLHTVQHSKNLPAQTHHYVFGTVVISEFGPVA